MEISVEVREIVSVTPSEPTPARVLSLSAIDSQLFLRFTIEYLLVYTAKPGLDRASTSAGIKAALAQALVPYFPLSGRVRAGPDGSRLQVLCRAQGALFIEAVSDQSMERFGTAPAFVNQWRELLSFQVADVLEGAPPLVVQLTWLKDGAVAIGVGINHCICDGIGSAEFLNSFADLADGRCKVSELEPKPVWNRHLLNPKLPNLSSKNSFTLPELRPVPDLSGFTARFSEEPLVPTSITFDKTSLLRLKNLAQSETRTGHLSYTSFEVLSSHIWRSWARSLNLQWNQKVKLLFSIDIRKRVQPSLPAGFYGNAFVLSCAQTCVKNLVNKGLGYAARLVKRAKERVNDEYVTKVVETVSESRESPDLVGVLVLSQWSRLGLERIDFGMGRPVHVGPICTDRYCLLLPVHDQTDAVKVMMAVPTSAVATYESLVRFSNTKDS